MKRTLKIGLLFVLTLFALSANFCLAQSKNSKIHVLSAYSTVAYGGWNEVFISKNANPIVLVLSSYEKNNWLINLQAGAKLERVIVNGYENQLVYFANTKDSSKYQVDYLITEKSCSPGETRPKTDKFSLSQFPSKDSASVRRLFLDELFKTTGISSSNVNFEISYAAKGKYVVK
jgi:hypothetical protein